MRDLKIFVLIVVTFVLFLIIKPANGQTDLALRLDQNETGYTMVCYMGCEWYNTLGTIDEINRRFPEYHCAINWAFFLQNRYYNIQFGSEPLGYLVGPNGDTSNPLCE